MDASSTNSNYANKEKSDLRLYPVQHIYYNIL